VPVEASVAVTFTVTFFVPALEQTLIVLLPVVVRVVASPNTQLNLATVTVAGVTVAAKVTL
jgi:hypothetical protein